MSDWRRRDYEELMELYERLDRYRNRRGRYLLYGVFYVVAMLLAVVLFRYLLIRTLASGIIGLVILVLGVGLIGLALLAQFVRNEAERRQLEKDVRRVKLRHQMGVVEEDEKPKRDEDDEDVRYAIGDDGELIEYYPDDEPLTEEDYR
jgi:Flp pilus assembly protein TadB